MQRKAIFLDRDGVLNDAIIKNGKPYPPATLDQVFISADVLPALTLLKASGFLLLGATNQPDVARGITTRAMVESINQKLLQDLPLDEVRVCYHDDKDACVCRKPAPGLLLQAATAFNVDLTQSFMIGDRWKDIEAGQRAGCKTIWLDRKYQEPTPKSPPNFVATTLLQAAEWIHQYQAGNNNENGS